MGFLSKILGGGLGTVIDAGKGLVTAFTGDQTKRDAYANAENMAGKRQFAAEFQVQNRTKFDSFMDGLNRLPRPAIVLMVLAYFNLAWIDDIQFQIVNVALDTVPDLMWQIAFAIISFYFVAREFTKSRDQKMAMNTKDFKENMKRMEALRNIRDERDSEEEAKADAALSHNKPNPAISAFLKAVEKVT